MVILSIYIRLGMKLIDKITIFPLFKLFSDGSALSSAYILSATKRWPITEQFEKGEDGYFINLQKIRYEIDW